MFEEQRRFDELELHEHRGAVGVRHHVDAGVKSTGGGVERTKGEVALGGGRGDRLVRRPVFLIAESRRSADRMTDATVDDDQRSLAVALDGR